MGNFLWCILLPIVTASILTSIQDNNIQDNIFLDFLDDIFHNMTYFSVHIIPTDEYSSRLLEKLFSHNVQTPLKTAQLILLPITRLGTNISAMDTIRFEETTIPRLLVFVITKTVHLLNEDEALNVMNLAWNKGFSQTRIVIRKADSLQILNFTPYVGYNFSGSLRRVSNEIAFRYSKSYPNMYGYPFRGSYFIFVPYVMQKMFRNNETMLTGPDIYLYNTIAKCLNASQETSVSKVLYLMLSDLFDNKSVYAINFQGVTLQKMKEYMVRFTYPYVMTSLCVLVHKAPKMPAYKNLFLPFSTQTWVAFFISVFIFNTLWHIIQITHLALMKPGKKMITTFGKTTFTTFRVLMNGSTSNANVDIINRITLIHLILFSVVMTNSFQGSLVTYLLLPIFMPEINNLQELDRSGLGIFGLFGTCNILVPNSPNDVVNSLRNKVSQVDNLFGILDLVINSKNMSGLMDKNSAKYWINSPRFSINGSRILHLIPECPVPILSSYAVAAKSPLFDSIETIKTRLFEAGILDHWHEDYFILKETVSSQIETQKLALNNLLLAFIFYVSGLILSLVIFALEIIKFHKYKVETRKSC